MFVVRSIAAAVLGFVAVMHAADTLTDPSNRFAWAENAGWLNAAPASGGIRVHFNGDSGHLSGRIWAENTGWIKLGADSGGPYANDSATNWGVNLNAAGTLSGYGWGENIGWINFNTLHGGVSVNPDTGVFTGHAWAENIGWIKMGGATPAYGIRTRAFERQPLGTPNWWLDHNVVDESSDEGDHVPAWQEYVADTSPNDSSSYLRIAGMVQSGQTAGVVFSPSSTRRFYTLNIRSNLVAGAWTGVPGQSDVQGAGGAQSLQDTNAAPGRFYAVGVSVSP